MRRHPFILLGLLFLAALPGSLHADYRLSDVPADEELNVSTAAPEETAFPGASLIKFDPGLWNESRRAVQEGREPGAPPAGVAASTSSVAPLPAGEAPGLINVELPYESGLSIAGRKLIQVKVQETQRKSAERARELGIPQQQRDFDMHQELQVKIKGKVGRKIAVNVDFDDTKDDKRDISVVYTGDPNEVVQEAAFGDIVLSLPSTEFVSYSKQLFGVRTKLKYKNAQFMAIGSRTKGVTETKRFNGNVKSDRREITDTSYIRHRYYNINFVPGRPIRPGTIRVWRDDYNPATNNPAITETGAQTGDFNTVVTSTNDLDLLKEGDDYALDLSRGLLILTRDAGLGDLMAIDYTFDDNGQALSQLGATPGLRKVIKTPADLPLTPAADPATSPESGFKREIKTYYSIGQNKIVPDDGRGNFILKTEDLNQLDNAVFLNNGQQLRYPDNVEVDFTNGRFNIAPVPVQVDTTTHKLYDPTPEHKFSFVVEYKYRVNSYVIKPNIVIGSERVTLNGRLLSRDVDYFMDYDSGFMTFFNEDQIDETSQIEVTYEFSPFGSQEGETLVGSRAELDLVPGRFHAGSTFLYDFAPKPTLVPDVRATPRSLMVLEADSQLKDWKVPLTPARLNLQAEVAKSKENPNLFGKAIVDSMEGVKQEVQAVMGPEAWAPGANADPSTNGVGRPDSLWTTLGDEQVRVHDINRNVSSERENDKVRILDMPFTLGSKPGGTGPETASLVQSFSRAGLDFSKKVSLELWVEGAGAAGAGVDMCVEAGQFNEDADGDGILDSEDHNLDGTLNFGEDTGWSFNDPGSNGARSGNVVVGAGNNRLDSEDLDGDGVLRRADLIPRGRPLFCLSPANSNPSANAGTQEVSMIDPQNNQSDRHTDLNFTGWRLISVPLNISPAEETDFQAIKQVRLSLRNDASAAVRTGSIRLAKLSFMGTTWEKPDVSAPGSTMTISAVNNVDNPDYNSLLGNSDYNDLYKDESTDRTREQALSLQYDLQPGSTATTREVYETPRDFSKHHTLKFFLQIPANKQAGGVFSFRIGSDNSTGLGGIDTNYYEYTVPLTNRYVGQWVEEVLDLVDLNNDGTPDIIQPLNPLGRFTVVGSPSFQRVGQLKLGVYNDGGAPLDSEVWVNEIHLTGSVKKEGHAQRFAADLSWPEWGTLGGRVRNVDRNFQTLTAQVLNQDQNQSDANFSFTRLRWMPLSGNVSKAETVTPAVFRTGDATLVSLLSEGRETTVTGRGDGQLLIPGLPAFGFSYDKNLSVSTTRGERRDRDTYTGSADYQLPWAPDVIPGKRFTLKPLPQSVFVKYSHTNNFFSVFDSTGFLSGKELAFNQSRTVEFTDEWSGRAPFAPWTGLTFQPGMSFKKVREERRFSDDTLALAPEFAAAKSYPKAQSQDFTFSGSWRLLRWLEPRFDGDLGGSENNNLPTASSPTFFNTKLVTRSAKTNLFWTFRAADLAPNFRPTQSFRLENSYQLESGDAYENVDRDFSGWRNMKPFSFKTVGRKDGRKMYSILKPLDVGAGGGRVTQATTRNSLRTSLDWTPFDWLDLRGRSEPLRTFRMTTTYTNTEEHDVTGDAVRDVSSTVWPDVLLSVRDTERFMRLERWMSNSQVNFRANRKDTETFAEEFRRDNSAGSDYHFVLKDKYDVFLSYGVTDGFSRSEQTGLLTAKSDGYSDSAQVGTRIGAWQVTPRADFKSDKSVDGGGRTTQDTQSQSYSVLLRLDRAYPRGFRIPFTHKIFENVNRLIIDGKVGFQRQSSSIDVDRNNTDNYTADMSGEWEISRNFRFSFGGGVSVLNNRVRKDDGVLSYNLTSQLVINF